MCKTFYTSHAHGISRERKKSFVTLTELISRLSFNRKCVCAAEIGKFQWNLLMKKKVVYKLRKQTKVTIDDTFEMDLHRIIFIHFHFYMNYENDENSPQENICRFVKIQVMKWKRTGKKRALNPAKYHIKKMADTVHFISQTHLHHYTTLLSTCLYGLHYTITLQWPNHSPVLEPLKLNLSFGLPFTPLPFCLPLVAGTVVGFKTIYFDLIVSLMELLKFKTSWYSILLNKTRFAEAINWLCMLESLDVPFPFDSGELLGKELRMAVEISEGDSQTTETGIFGPMNNTASGRIYGMLTCTRRCVLLLAALPQLSVCWMISVFYSVQSDTVLPNWTTTIYKCSMVLLVALLNKKQLFLRLNSNQNMRIKHTLFKNWGYTTFLLWAAMMRMDFFSKKHGG